MRALIAARPGCTSITPQELQAKWVHHHIPLWSLPLLTVVQSSRANGGPTVDRIVYADDQLPSTDRFCRLHEGSYLRDEFDIRIHLGGGRLDFGTLRASLEARAKPR